MLASATDNYVGLGIAAMLIVFLVLALIFPERF
jgi:K+-transporting ATPase KdpF subunit